MIIMLRRVKELRKKELEMKHSSSQKQKERIQESVARAKMFRRRQLLTRVGLAPWCRLVAEALLVYTNIYTIINFFFKTFFFSLFHKK